jgi:homogentisate 1,2-dioxygenase
MPKQLRWEPLPDVPQTSLKTFLQGIFSFCGAGCPSSNEGISIMGYSFNKSMNNEYFYSADGDWVFIPQTGSLLLETEMGKMEIKVGEFGVVPRGIKYKVVASEIGHKGWICEIYGDHLQLPELGPIGANGLANPQDFEIPTAHFEDVEGNHTIYAKFLGEFFSSQSEHSPLNIVAWRGNYYPFKYDFRKYCVINSVSFDHPDPSIFTVLSSMSNREGVAVLDLVIFKQRYMVAENTFRPPYFHRNIMSEFMGNIYGEYDAKPSGGFSPGCSSLHLPMTPHGPESEVVEKSMNEHLKPIKYQDTMSFMFESCFLFKISKSVIGPKGIPLKDDNYNECWKNMKKHFTS